MASLASWRKPTWLMMPAMADCDCMQWPWLLGPMVIMFCLCPPKVHPPIAFCMCAPMHVMSSAIRQPLLANYQYHTGKLPTPALLDRECKVPPPNRRSLFEGHGERSALLSALRRAWCANSHERIANSLCSLPQQPLGFMGACPNTKHHRPGVLPHVGVILLDLVRRNWG